MSPDLYELELATAHRRVIDAARAVVATFPPAGLFAALRPVSELAAALDALDELERQAEAGR